MTREVGEIVFNAGDLYCDVREITPETIIEGIGNQTYTDLVKLTTGGTSSILFDVANRHIDIMSCNGSQLNEKLKEWIDCVTSKSTVSQNEYFYPIDVNRSIIISQTNPTANLYLRPGFAGITLDDLVIINDADFQTLNNWSKNVRVALNRAEQKAAILPTPNLCADTNQPVVPQPSIVPDVLQMNPAAAAIEIRAADLIPRFMGPRGPDAEVQRQTPAAGTVVDRGSMVTLQMRVEPPH